MKRKGKERPEKIKKIKKKGQVRLSETIAVLFIFFVLLLFGIIFYTKYQQIAFKEKNEELLGKRAIETSLKTLYMPELICSRGKAEPEDYCFDLLKLQTLNATLKKYLDNYYFDFFSYAKIYVQEVYPGNQRWILYDKPKQEITMEEKTYFVITLKDDVSEDVEAQHRFGYVAVVVYS